MRQSRNCQAADCCWELAPQIKHYQEMAAGEGKPAQEVVTFISLDEADETASRAKLNRYEEAGVTRVIVGKSYTNAEQWVPLFDLIN